MNPKDGVGAKKAPLRYVPPTAMLAIAPIMENGAAKYGPFNWRQQPVSAITYVEAALRHLFAWLDGQDNVEDSNLPHIAHAVASLAILLDAQANDTWIDDRFTPGPAPRLLREMDKSLTRPEVSHEGPYVGLETCPSCFEDQRMLAVIEADRAENPEFFYGMPPEQWAAYGVLTADHRGELGVDFRDEGGYLVCCGATEHTLECPRWR